MSRGDSRETVDLAAQTTILRRRSWRRLGVAGAAFVLLFSFGFGINLTESGVPADVLLFVAGGQWKGRPCMVPVKLLPEGTYRKYGEN